MRSGKLGPLKGSYFSEGFFNLVFVSVILHPALTATLIVLSLG